MNRILIVDDEVQIASFLLKGLRAGGFTPTAVPDGRSALELTAHREFDLLLLDIGLPDLDGFTVLRRLRRAGHTLPVIVLTVRDSVSDTVAALEGGADDYLVKPFQFDELVARIRVRLQNTRSPVVTVLRHGDVSLDLQTRRASIGGKLVDLSPRQFTLVETLLNHPDRVWSREELLTRVWGYDFEPSSNVVEVCVRGLRRRIGHHRIQNLRGAGYRLVTESPTLDRRPQS